ncbi:ABC transporter substrate-binding protein [Amnibacterium kyonggiense]|uniref:Carbohydrate ABC transporter substrate-binding protein (CUT1 family) n=1 Tax=Amnibacterium kyonggiense TaxID=595671 RepID=A0A4V3EAN0_9MICO|nr:sugar ABC transporter substrate-binding protein [Amnibacterium kyonggiense]TDS77234.1 carbohydrate ABC transporter substrate-binding protein (CUT1 family) [Amnibacterium kyonggiense]
MSIRTTPVARRTVLGGAVLAASAGLLSACAFNSGGSTPQASSGKKVTLTFQSLAFQATTIAAVKKIVTSWNASHPDIQIDLRQGSWDNVHDQLVTQFQGGTAPDIIHDEAADITGFAEQGYLADLKPYLSSSVQQAVPAGIWKAVTVNGKIVAAPTLLQTYVVFANKKAFADAGVSMPTGDSMTWDRFRSIAKQLTKNGKYGVGWGLSQPAATVLSTSLNYGGTWFTGTGKDAQIQIGANELKVPETIQAMARTDRSIAPTSITQSGSDALPGFFGGKYAMYVGGNYVAQQITQSGPKGFEWDVLPPLAGSAGTAQAADPQTMSVSATSKAQQQAAQFIDYFMSATNQAALAQGDWLIPASEPAQQEVLKETGGKDGWEQTIASGKGLTAAPFQTATNYPQWKDQYATPLLQKYFAGSITTDQLKSQLTAGWQSVNK